MDALAQAQKVAEQLAQASVQAGAVATSTAVVPAAAPSLPAVPGRRLTMDDSIGNVLVVEKWISLKALGGAGAFVVIGKGQEAVSVESMDVAIDMIPDVGFVKSYALSYGNPVQYAKTYDGVNAHGGGTWAEALDKAARQDPKKARPFDSVDLVMSNVEDIKNKAGQVAVKAGTKLGWSASQTNYAPWLKFYNDCKAKGLVGQTVRARVSAKEEHRNGNNWAVIQIELVTQ